MTVSGNVDPSLLIKKLAKAGKHAEIWGSQQKPCLNNKLKNLQINPQNNGKGQKGHNNNNNIDKNNPPKGSGHQQPFPFTPQQIQQIRGFQDLKLPPQFKDLQLPAGFKDPIPNPNQHKAVKFSLPPEEDDRMIDDAFDDEFDDVEEFDSDGYDVDIEDEMDDFHHRHPGGGNNNKVMTRPVMGSNGAMGGVPNAMLNALMNGGNYPQLMQGGGGGNNGKKGGGGGGALPVHTGGGGGGNGGKKGVNQNQGGGEGAGKNGGKNDGGGGHNGGKKGGGGSGGGSGFGLEGMNVGGFHPMDKDFRVPGGNTRGGGGSGSPIGQMGGGMPAIQGLPTLSGGQGYFQGGGGGAAGPAAPGSNPYLQHQQQYMAAMMNQRAAAMADGGAGGVGGGGDPRFQPMMYARPAPAVNYMPPYPYPYPYPYPHPPHSDPYTHVFSDENTSSCSIM